MPNGDGMAEKHFWNLRLDSSPHEFFELVHNLAVHFEVSSSLRELIATILHAFPNLVAYKHDGAWDSTSWITNSLSSTSGASLHCLEIRSRIVGPVGLLVLISESLPSLGELHIPCEDCGASHLELTDIKTVITLPLVHTLTIGNLFPLKNIIWDTPRLCALCQPWGVRFSVYRHLSPAFDHLSKQIRILRMATPYEALSDVLNYFSGVESTILYLMAFTEPSTHTGSFPSLREVIVVVGDYLEHLGGIERYATEKAFKFLTDRARFPSVAHIHFHRVGEGSSARLWVDAGLGIRLGCTWSENESPGVAGAEVSRTAAVPTV